MSFTSTASLGYRLVEEIVSQPALSFDLIVAPLSRGLLERHGVAAGVRAALLSEVLLPVVPSAVIDQIFIASIFEDEVGGSGHAYNSSAPVNVDGNAFLSIDDFMAALGGKGGVAAAPGRQRAALAALAGRRAEAGTGGAVKQLQRRLPRRVSSMTLVGSAAAPRAANAGSLSSTITFNLVFATPADASRVSGRLKGAGYRRAEGPSALEAAISNRTGANATSAYVDESSIKPILLQFRRTYWGIFLQWLYDNIRYVLAGACTVAAVFGLLILVQQGCKRRAAQRVALRNKLAAERLAQPIVRADVTRKMRLARIRLALRNNLHAAIIKTAAQIRAAKFTPAARVANSRHAAGARAAARGRRAHEHIVVDHRNIMEASLNIVEMDRLGGDDPEV
jgi:hypothetical protein